MNKPQNTNPSPSGIRHPALFLIITPSFNQAQFIGQTIDSVFSQKGNFDVAYVIMDGGSSDGTVKILENYSSVIRHPPSVIRHYYFKSQKDKGQTDAINKGIKYMLNAAWLMPKANSAIRHSPSSIFFSYLNSDDYYLPDTLSKVVAAFQKNPTKQWLVGDSQIVDGKGSEIQKWVRVYKQILRKIYQMFPSLIYILNPIPQPSTFIRWSAVQELGEFDQNLHYVMDYQYWLRLQNKFGLPIFLNQSLSGFRIHGQSKGGSQFEKQFAEQYMVAQKFTNNKLFLLLHQAHNWVTTMMYKKMK